MQKLNATASKTDSTAQSVQTLQATVNGHTASIKTSQDAVADINGKLAAKYTLITDTNGYVMGYELFNGGAGMSTFTIAADKFLISRPGVKDPKQLFVYDSSTGSLVLKNLVVDGATIKDATITSARIADASIGTLKLADSAATSISSGYSSGQMWMDTISDNYMLYIPVDTIANRPVIITAQFETEPVTDNGDFVYVVTIGRGNSQAVAAGNKIIQTRVKASNHAHSGSFVFNDQRTVTAIDNTPPGGRQYYWLFATYTPTATSPGTSYYSYFFNIRLAATSAKR